MGSGVSKVQTGSVLGAGAADIDVRTVMFRPSKVVLHNEGGLAESVWQDTMADGEMLKRVTAGTMSKVVTTGITPLSDGFRIGQDADMNVAGELIHWTAFE